MIRYRAVVAEVATGKVRRPNALATRAFVGESVWRSFESEESALKFKDEVLVDYPDLEVTVLSSIPGERGRLFFRQDGEIRCRELSSDANPA